MWKFVASALIAACLAPGLAHAQAASPEETKAVSAITECLLDGLPPDWVQAHVIVELAKAGAETGNVQYLVAREEAEDQLEPFTPCDIKKPARALLDVRKSQNAKRRAWTIARLVLNSSGQFALTFDYPK